ncbi:MAG: serine/threonine-protein kinase [Myxococcota bacterium]
MEDANASSGGDRTDAPTVTVGTGVTAPVPDVSAPPRLDRYRILQGVGRGGMSVVYAAHDRQLDRDVALKVLRRNEDQPLDEARLFAEARTLAGLAHPNIVPVFDVGRSHDGDVYMAMELVRGKTLLQWLGAATRTWPEVVDVLMQAGRGLAGAHAMDLVHCDFKPGNVLVGDDGRVRVVDFGIAQRTLLSRTLVSTNAEDAASPRLRMVVGTPRYVSPEQAAGRPLEPPSDQFSFCVTMYEALYGQHPFAGRDHRQRLRQARAGIIRPAPRGTAVPGRVHAVIRRGLRRAPSERWPSMNALLEALERARASRRRTIALAISCGLGLGFGALGLSATPDPCASTRAALDDAWSPQRRDRIHDAFVASSLPAAEAQATGLDESLSTFVSDWVQTRYDACTTTKRTPAQSSATLDCLRDAKTQFVVLVEELGTAEAEVLRNGSEVVSSLRDPVTCSEAQSGVPPSTASSPRSRSLARSLERVPVLLGLHRYERADELTKKVLHEARQLGDPSLLADALSRRGDVLDGRGLVSDAVELWEQAFHAANEVDRDLLAAEIALGLQVAYGYDLDQPKPAARWSGLARAAVERLGDSADWRGPEQVRTEGLIELRASNFSVARDHFIDALAAFEAIGDHGTLRYAEAQSNLGIANLNLGRLEEAERDLTRARALTEGVVGPYNSRLITVLNNLGSLAQMQGDHASAATYFQRVYEAEVAVFGPDDVRVAMSTNNLGTALSSIRRDDEAEAYYRRSIAAYESGEHIDIDLARPMGNLAVCLMRRKSFDEAEMHLLRAIELIQGEGGPRHADLSGQWFNLGSVYIDTDQPEKALEAMERSLEVDRHVLGDDHVYIAQTIGAMAKVHARQNRPTQARSLLEEAIAMYRRVEGDPMLVATAELDLAELLWESGQRDAADALVPQAEAALKRAGASGKPRLEELKAWMRSR